MSGALTENSLALEARRRFGIEPLQLGGLEGRSFMIPRSHPVNPIGITAGKVWHYTGLGGLRGILQTSSFWASSYRTMNDPGEIEYGLDVLGEAWRSISAGYPQQTVRYIDRLIDPGSLSEAFDHVHLLSASREGDSLSQWRAYAGKDGVSLGLDASAPLWSDPRVLQVTSPNIWDMSWVKVLYRRPVQLARGRHFLLEILRRLEQDAFPGNPAAYMTSQMYTIAQVASFKHPAYADERELRSTVMLGGARPPIRDTTSGATPYVPFIRLGQSGEVLPLPVTTVRFGPAASPDQVATYRRIMDEAGYERTPLVASTIPFR